MLYLVDFVGNVINIQTGMWTGKLSGLGAGMDSFYEYLLKAKPLNLMIDVWSSHCPCFVAGFYSIWI